MKSKFSIAIMLAMMMLAAPILAQGVDAVKPKALEKGLNAFFDEKGNKDACAVFAIKENNGDPTESKWVYNNTKDEQCFPKEPEPPVNQPPEIKVHSPMDAQVNDTVIMEITELSDPEGDNITSIQWEQREGANVSLTIANDSLSAEFIPTVEDKYVFGIDASDSKNATGHSSITVNVKAIVPEPVECEEGTTWNGTACVPDIVIPPVEQCDEGEIFNATSGLCEQIPIPPEDNDTDPTPTGEICGDNIDNDNDGITDEDCVVDQDGDLVRDNFDNCPTVANADQKDSDNDGIGDACDTTNPPNPQPTSIPAVNETKNVRIASIADADNNNGWITQLDLMVKHGVQFLVINGDIDYNDIKWILNEAQKRGFTSANTFISVGNHDNCSDIRAFSGMATCVEDFTLIPEVDVFTLDGKESGFDCSTSQFTNIKAKIESSDAWYKIISIHEPFMTVKSDHPPNGGFNCWSTLFEENGVQLVLQGHNHNYQYVEINDVVYKVDGTGTHDTGSKMYPCDSSSFNSVPVKCITGTNGVSIMDLQIDDPAKRVINGYFVSNADKLIHSWVYN